MGHISSPWHTCSVIRGRTLGIRQGWEIHFHALWYCVERRGQRGNNVTCLALAPLSVTSLTSHKQTVTFQVPIPRWVGLCTILGSYGPLQWTFLGHWEFLPPPKPIQIFIDRGFEALFHHTGTLSCADCLLPSCSSQFICMKLWDILVCQPLPHPPHLLPATTLP